MDIVFLMDQFPTLSETFIKNQFSSLLDQGENVHVAARTGNLATSAPESDEDADFRSRVHYADIPRAKIDRVFETVSFLFDRDSRSGATLLRSLNLFQYGRPALTLELLYFAQLFRSLPEPDIVHAHYGPIGHLAACLKHLGVFEAPLVTTFYGHDVSRYVRQHGDGVYEFLFNGADRLLALSEDMQEKLKSLGCSEHKIEIHPLGVDPRKFKGAGGDQPDGSESPVRLLTVARLVDKKGLFDSLRAVRRLLEEGHELHYRIIGAGPLREKLRGMIDEKGLGEAVQLLGALPREDVIRSLRDSDVFLLASKTSPAGDEEGTPTVLLEAQAAGVPVVTTRHAGIPEIVRHDETGFLVEEGDVEALVERMRTLIEQPSLRKAMGKAGRKWIQDHHDIGDLTGRLCGIYTRLIGSTSNSAAS